MLCSCFDICLQSLDTSDLYVTRVLHETKLDLTPLPTRTPSTSAESSVAAFEAAIARIEDSDDQLALEQTSLENSMEIVEFEKVVKLVGSVTLYILAFMDITG